MNIWSVVIKGVIGKWGVYGVNENGQNFMDVYVERGVFMTNSLF